MSGVRGAHSHHLHWRTFSAPGSIHMSRELPQRRSAPFGPAMPRLVLALGLAFAPPVSAQETAEVDAPSPTEASVPSEMTPEAAAVEVNRELRSVVTASRPAKAASETTVEREVIEIAPRRGAVDLLRLVPGLVASQHSGEGKAHQLFLRGFDAVHGQDVELEVGGIPVNQVSHLHALGYADLNFLIPEVVHAIHVTEGAYRAAQGDFAIAGTVRFDLGMAEQGVQLGATAEQFGGRRLFAGVRPGDSPETFAAAEIAQGDGYGQQRAWGRASVLAQAVHRFTLSNGRPLRLRALAGSYTARFDSPGVVREDLEHAGRIGFFDASAPGQGGSASRHQVLLGAEMTHARAARTRLEAFGAMTALRLRNNFTGYAVDLRGDGIEQAQENVTLGLRAEHRRRLSVFSRPLQISLGVGARRDDIDQAQRRYRDVDGIYFAREIDAEVTQTDFWTWAESELVLGRWKLMLGGRADALGFEVFDALGLSAPAADVLPDLARTAFGVHLGLKAGVMRLLGERWQIFANYGDGFRSPQARSLAQGERAPFVNVHGGEVGARYGGERLALNGAIFGSYVADDFFFDHTIGTTHFLGPTLRSGASIGARLAPFRGLLASINGTFAHAVVTRTGALLPYFAPLVGRADVGYERTVAILSRELKLNAGTGLTLIGPRPLPYGERSRTVFLADLGLGARSGPVGLRLEVQNLLDARWRDGEFVYPSRFDPSAPASLLPARHFTAGNPRIVSLTLEVFL